METAQMDSENVIHKHCGILLSCKENEMMDFAGKWITLIMLTLIMDNIDKWITQIPHDEHHMFSHIEASGSKISDMCTCLEQLQKPGKQDRAIANGLGTTEREQQGTGDLSW